MVGRVLVPVVLLAIGEAAAALAPRPIVIAHRGASAYRPEHTLEAYRLAVEMGADYIEPDLCSTKDGVLIARHEHEIGSTTDVADRFPDRRRTGMVDGREVTGWFTEDFTLAEIKTLRARERLPYRSHEYDGRFTIPTFDEVIALAKEMGAARGRPVGLYPETKHPSHFRSIGLPIEDPLLASLTKNGLDSRDAPVFIQSFEAANLQALRPKTTVRLVQLASTPAAVSAEALKTIATYADGIGVEKRLVVPVGPDGALLPPTDLVTRAHAAGLLVHVWTLRSEANFLPAGYKGRPEAEFEQMQALGVDGVFTDFPDIAVKVFGPVK